MVHQFLFQDDKTKKEFDGTNQTPIAVLVIAAKEIKLYTTSFYVFPNMKHI